MRGLQDMREWFGAKHSPWRNSSGSRALLTVRTAGLSPCELRHPQPVLPSQQVSRADVVQRASPAALRPSRPRCGA
eukprot:scaffold363_cov430-Prasinococcus_capsulatus_cf.AAC.2